MGVNTERTKYNDHSNSNNSNFDNSEDDDDKDYDYSYNHNCNNVYDNDYARDNEENYDENN